MKTYKITCLNEKEAIKLFNMLNKFKKEDYIGDGEIRQDGRIVIFKIKYEGGMWIR